MSYIKKKNSQPDRTFYNSTASKFGDRCIFCSSRSTDLEKCNVWSGANFFSCQVKEIKSRGSGESIPWKR